MNLFAFSGLSVAIACSLLVALLLLFGRREIHRVLSLFNLAVAVWGFGLFLAGTAESGEAALAAWKIAHFGGLFVGPTFYHFTAVFCGRDRRTLIRVGYVQAAFFLALVVATDVAFERTREVFGLHYLDPNPPYLLAIGFYAFFVLASYAELLRFLPAARGRKRTQTLWVILGFLFGFSGATYTFLPMYGIGPIYPSGNLGITLYCIILGYAILRHRVMDVRVALRSGLVYSLTAGLLTGLLVMLLVLLSTRVGELTGLTPHGVTLLAALALALGFAPLKRQVQTIADRVFRRVGRDTPSVLRDLGRELLSTIDFDEVCRLIVATAAEKLPVRGAVLLAAGEGGYARVSSAGALPDRIDETGPPLRPESALVVIARSRGVLLRDDLLEITSEESARIVMATLDSLGAEAVVPIVIHHRPEFLLVLGEKLFGDGFSSEDVDLLGAISSQAAMALRNSILHRDLSGAFRRLQAEAVERRRGEAALLRASEEWRATFDSTSEAIVMVDPGLRIVRANRASSALFGRDLRTLAGRDLPDLLRPLLEPGCGDLLPRPRRPGERAEIEAFVPGSKRWIHVACDPVPGNAAGLAGGAVYTLRDVTELKTMQASILAAKRDWEACFDTISEAITLHDMDFTIVRANRSAATLLGLPLAGLAGRKCHVAYHGTTCPPQGCPSCGVAQTGGIVVQELYEPHLGKHLEIKALPRLTGDGRISGVVHVVRDISAQKRAEQALRYSESRFRDIAENAQAWVWETDATGRYTYTNQMVEKILGYTTEETLAAHYSDFLLPEDRESLLETLAAQRPFRELEIRKVDRNGRPVWLATSALPLVDDRGSLLGFRGADTDITERKWVLDALQELAAELEQRVRERTAELTAANRELEGFAATVSHDLRTPLHAILSFSHAVLEHDGDTLTESARDSLERIGRAGERMAELINGLLDLSQCALGRLERAPVDISAIARDCLEDLGRQEPTRTVAGIVEPGLRAHGDPRLVDALLRNLIGNAWKYTARTGGAEIRVQGRELEGRPAFCVSDNGAGFDSALAGKLFQPFQRLHGADEFPGLGIGLATVQRIASRHGGRVTAEGRIGRGATFCFTLEPPAEVPEP